MADRIKTARKYFADSYQQNVAGAGDFPSRVDIVLQRDVKRYGTISFWSDGTISGDFHFFGEDESERGFVRHAFVRYAMLCGELGGK